MRSCTKLALPVLGLLLLLAEGGVLALCLFYPRVDRFYASYYMTDARSCWLHGGAITQAEMELRAPHLDVPALSVPARCFLLAKGWSDVERWGVWSNGSVADLDLMKPPGRQRLTMTFAGFSGKNRQGVEILVDGLAAGKFVIARTTVSRLTIDVPPDAAGDVEIMLKIAHPTMPGPGDHRRLGVGLIALDWS